VRKKGKMIMSSDRELIPVAYWFSETSKLEVTLRDGNGQTWTKKFRSELEALEYLEKAGIISDVDKQRLKQLRREKAKKNDRGLGM